MYADSKYQAYGHKKLVVKIYYSAFVNKDGHAGMHQG